jgi:hypothetical protein
MLEIYHCLLPGEDYSRFPRILALSSAQALKHPGSEEKRTVKGQEQNSEKWFLEEGGPQKASFGNYSVPYSGRLVSF